MPVPLAARDRVGADAEPVPLALEEACVGAGVFVVDEAEGPAPVVGERGREIAQDDLARAGIRPEPPERGFPQRGVGRDGGVGGVVGEVPDFAVDGGGADLAGFANSLLRGGGSGEGDEKGEGAH